VAFVYAGWICVAGSCNHHHIVDRSLIIAVSENRISFGSGKLGVETWKNLF